MVKWVADHLGARYDQPSVPVIAARSPECALTSRCRRGVALNVPARLDPSLAGGRHDVTPHCLPRGCARGCLRRTGRASRRLSRGAHRRLPAERPSTPISAASSAPPSCLTLLVPQRSYRQQDQQKGRAAPLVAAEVLEFGGWRSYELMFDTRFHGASPTTSRARLARRAQRALAGPTRRVQLQRSRNPGSRAHRVGAGRRGVRGGFGHSVGR